MMFAIPYTFAHNKSFWIALKIWEFEQKMKIHNCYYEK